MNWVLLITLLRNQFIIQLCVLVRRVGNMVFFDLYFIIDVSCQAYTKAIYYLHYVLPPPPMFPPNFWYRDII